MSRYSTPTRGNPFDRAQGRSATKWAAWFAVIGTALLIVAALSVHSCGVEIDADTAACGRVERTLLGLAAPITLGIGTIGAFIRTYRIWRADGVWWAWQGAGWFLLTLTLFTLTMGFPPIAGLGSG
ncbi:MAG: hypothetical protein U0R18_14455 [Mycobacterium sp.]